MSITLLCLVKGNTTANAFPIDIDRDQLVACWPPQRRYLGEKST